MFHCEIQNDHAAIKAEEEAYKPILVIEQVTELDLQENYKRIKREVGELIAIEISKLQIEVNQQKDDSDGEREALSL